MKAEILLSTMFYEKEKDDFLSKMNVQTDIIVGNQCDINKNAVEEFNGHKVTILSRKERGVGKNRNVSLFYSDADIIIFADNDVCYYDGYAEIIEDFYVKHPDADIVIFNYLEKRGEDSFRDVNRKNKVAKLHDLMKFGTWAITARRESILKGRISFSLLFGGGTRYSAGEDSLFLADCYHRGLKIYLCDKTIGNVVHKESTWYNGITKKLLYDRGALYCALSPKFYGGIIVYHALKHKKVYASVGNTFENICTMLSGAKEYRLKE